MTLPTVSLMTALLLPLAAAAPASPGDRGNIGLRRQLAAPAGLVRTTDPPAEEETTQALDSSDTTQALVCSQIFGVLPFTTFRRQRFDSFTTCHCVSSKSAVCEPDTFYPTVTPGTPEAALAQEHSFAGADKFIEVLNAFSVQQTCFFEHLRGQRLSPPRPCAFSWERGSRPACDCAKPPDVPTPAEMEVEVTVSAEVPEPTEPAPEPSQQSIPESSLELGPETSRETSPESSPEAPKATDLPSKAAVQAVKLTTRSAEPTQAATMTTKATDAPMEAASAEVEVVDLSEFSGENSGSTVERVRRGPQVAEAYHLRRVRDVRRH